MNCFSLISSYVMPTNSVHMKWSHRTNLSQPTFFTSSPSAPLSNTSVQLIIFVFRGGNMDYAFSAAYLCFFLFSFFFICLASVLFVYTFSFCWSLFSSKNFRCEVEDGSFFFQILLEGGQNKEFLKLVILFFSLFLLVSCVWLLSCHLCGWLRLDFFFVLIVFSRFCSKVRLLYCQN